MQSAKRLLLFFLLAALLAPASPAQAVTYDIAHLYSNVSFSITKIFFKEEGGFRDYSGQVVFDAAHPERSRVQMTVQAASIDTRIETRDKVLRSDDFFDVERYPTLGFVSTSVTPRSANLLDVAGDLTIRGVTRHITIPVRYLGHRQMAGWHDFVGFETEFAIDRTDFGVNGTRWSGGNLILSKQVNIRLSIGAVRPGS
jgi:polyisoprenoid-binding protein YceI